MTADDYEPELRRQLWRLVLSWRKDEQALRENAKCALDSIRTEKGLMLEKLVHVRSLDAGADMLTECGDRLEELLEGDDEDAT